MKYHYTWKGRVLEVSRDPAGPGSAMIKLDDDLGNASVVGYVPLAALLEAADKMKSEIIGVRRALFAEVIKKLMIDVMDCRIVYDPVIVTITVRDLVAQVFRNGDIEMRIEFGAKDATITWQQAERISEVGNLIRDWAPLLERA